MSLWLGNTVIETVPEKLFRGLNNSAERFLRCSHTMDQERPPRDRGISLPGLVAFTQIVAGTQKNPRRFQPSRPACDTHLPRIVSRFRTACLVLPQPSVTAAIRLGNSTGHSPLIVPAKAAGKSCDFDTMIDVYNL